MDWTITDIPDQSGKIILITGGNSGIGYEAARALAGKGAHIILACRTKSKADAAIAKIKADFPGAEIKFLELDLASLTSVKKAADSVLKDYKHIDVLVNNGGVAWHPRKLTSDGFELHFGTNHLGHFALTAQLLPLLLAAGNPRVISISSIAHRFGKIHFDDINLKRYNMFSSYGQSKVANLLFTYELQRRFEAAGLSAKAVAAHPGMSNTNLATASIKDRGQDWLADLTDSLAGFVTQTPREGALPTLRAATAPDVRGADYYGPKNMFEMVGPPVKVGSTGYSRDPQVAKRLWDLSEQMTGVHFEVKA